MQLTQITFSDIVFFGESLPSEFYHNLDEDSEKVYVLYRGVARIFSEGRTIFEIQ